MKTSLLTLFLTLFFAFGVFAQEEMNDDSFIVSGKVINAENLEGVSFANVNLQGTNWGIVCDSAGFFRLRIHPDQNLRISALGFKEQSVSITPPQAEEEEVFQEIFMEQGSILLNEVSIYSLGTWNQFKENFIKTDAPEEENIAASFDFGNLKLAQAEANALSRKGLGFNLLDGISAIKSIGQKRRARKGIVEMTDWQLRILQQKYNKEVIAELTHESGFRLDQLMEYINSKQNFTYQTSEMYIGVRIQQLYTDFLQEKPQFENDLSFTDSLGTIRNHLRP
ncbi:carboxypeptidase-like regulatory domain-containing protein [Labilibaculum euxinus]